MPGHPVDGWDLEKVLAFVAGLINVTKDNLEYKDITEGFKTFADIKGPKTVGVYMYIPFGDIVEFENGLEISRDWVYVVKEIPDGQWLLTDNVKIKLIERK